MIKRKNGSVEWLEFELFSNISNLCHKIYLNKGGTSRGCYRSLNLGWYCGDKEEDVAQNRLLAGCSHSVASKHVHGTTITEVNCLDKRIVPECDALITSKPGICLMTTHADCQTALFYDPKNRAIANVHCGWRGNVENIYGKAVAVMAEKYGTKPQDLLVGVGPSLGPDHAEFIHFKKELPPSFWDFQTKNCHFNFWEIARMQLRQAGIPESQIEIAEICTYSDPENFFSYRRDKKCGRHGTVIELLE